MIDPELEARLNRLREYVHYDPETGVVSCIKRRPGGKWEVGVEIGNADRYGYLQFQSEGRQYLLHRVIYFLMTGTYPPIVDHKDGHRQNNAWLNLREANPSQSAANRGPRKNQRYPKGVETIRNSPRFQARITVRGTRIALGIFDTPEEAHAAYCIAAAKFHGEFARAA